MSNQKNSPNPSQKDSQPNSVNNEESVQLAADGNPELESFSSQQRQEMMDDPTRLLNERIDPQLGYNQEKVNPMEGFVTVNQPLQEEVQQGTLFSTSPPQESMPSVDLPEKTPTDDLDAKVCREIREYCTMNCVALVMKEMCEKVPQALPNYRTWNTTKDPVVEVHGVIHYEGFIEDKLTVLKMMLPSNIQNISWAARTLVALAVYGTAEWIANETEN